MMSLFEKLKNNFLLLQKYIIIFKVINTPHDMIERKSNVTPQKRILKELFYV